MLIITPNTNNSWNVKQEVGLMTTERFSDVLIYTCDSLACNICVVGDDGIYTTKPHLL